MHPWTPAAAATTPSRHRDMSQALGDITNYTDRLSANSARKSPAAAAAAAAAAADASNVNNSVDSVSSDF